MTKEKYFELINGHVNKGEIGNRYAVTIIDNSLVKFDKFTLKLSRLHGSHMDMRVQNAQLIKLIKAKSNLYKEIREFNLLFRFFNKLGICEGFIRKTERPDFEFNHNGMNYGIEVTRIYTGNDWAAEKVNTEITSYKMTNEQFYNYIHHGNYNSKVKVEDKNKRHIVKAIKHSEFKEDEINKIKNKLFEKIRKQIDEYDKFDINYIFAEVVFTGYKELKDIVKLNEELHYFVSHLDIIWGKNKFHLLLKVGNTFIDFNLRKGTYKII